MSPDPFYIVFTLNPTYQDTFSSSSENPLLSKYGSKASLIKIKDKNLPFLLVYHQNKKKDNIIHQIKLHYHHFLLKYINNYLSIKRLRIKTFLEKLEDKFNSYTSIIKNLSLLSTSISQVLSTNISEFLANFDREHNKNPYIRGLLELIYEYMCMNVFIVNGGDLYENVEYLRKEIPHECLFGRLLDKNEDDDVDDTLKEKSGGRFMWKIVNGVARSQKLNVKKKYCINMNMNMVDDM